MALNVSKMKDLVAQLQAELALFEPGGKHENRVQPEVMERPGVPKGWDLAQVKWLGMKSSKKAKDYLSLGVATDPESPLRFIQVWDANLIDLAKEAKGKWIVFQMKPNRDGSEPFIVADLRMA